MPQGKLPFRLNATMNQNVVTYTVVVSADNEDGKLSPYLTANLSFIVADKKDALLVPNAALRWQPPSEQIAPDQRDAYFELAGKKRSPTDPEPLDQVLSGSRATTASCATSSSNRPERQPSTRRSKACVNGELPEEHTSIVGEGKADGATPAAPIRSSHRHSQEKTSRVASGPVVGQMGALRQPRVSTRPPDHSPTRHPLTRPRGTP